MHSALDFSESDPAARPLILTGRHLARARPAADARIALIVQGIVGHVVIEQVFPQIALCPVGEWRDLDEAETRLAPDNGRMRAGRGLIAAERADPGVRSVQRPLERLDLADAAALVRVLM